MRAHWSTVSGPIECGPHQLLLSPQTTVLTLSPAAEVHKVSSGLGEGELINLIPHFLEEVLILFVSDRQKQRLRLKRDTDRYRLAETKRKRSNKSQRHRDRDRQTDGQNPW